MHRLALDLEKNMGCHIRGPVTVWLTWWLANDAGPRPCLALTPTHGRWADGRSQPYVVMLDDAHLWSEAIGDPRHAARESVRCCQAIGLDATDANNVVRIRSIIADHLGDLIAMPPMPASMREEEAVADIRLSERDGGTVIEREMKESV